MKVAIFTLTDGLGCWSGHAKSVKILEIYLNYVDGTDHGELHAKFRKSDWNPARDGLIYTDECWLKGFNHKLVEMGGTPVSYSEQGMQGDNYVSLDVGKKFLTSELGKKLMQGFKTAWVKEHC